MLSQTSQLHYLQTRCVQKCDLGVYLSINSIGGECYASFSDPNSFAEKPECRRCVNYGADVSYACCLET